MITIKFWDTDGCQYVTHEDIEYGEALAVGSDGIVYLIDGANTMQFSGIEAHYYFDGERIA